MDVYGTDLHKSERSIIDIYRHYKRSADLHKSETSIIDIVACRTVE